MVIVLRVYAFEVVAPISFNSDKNTCDSFSMA